MPGANSDKQAIESSEPWQDSSAKALARREEDAKDIIIDDLSATLEAHRASNRAVVRKVETRAMDSTIKRPLLDKSGDGGSQVKQTHEGKEDGLHQMWPAYSVQAKERYRKTGSTSFVKWADSLEYTGATQWAKRPWEISQSSKNMTMQRPWLSYMGTTNEDHRERFVLKSHQGYRYR